MKLLSVIIAVILSGTVLSAAEDHLIGHWDFADANGNAVPGKTGPAGTIIRLGKSSEIVERAGRKMLKIANDFKERNKSGGFLVRKMPLDPVKPFTIICNFYFDQEINYRETKEFFSISDGEKQQGFRVFYTWGSLIIRTGDGKKLTQVGSKAGTFRMPFGRLAQLAAVYDGKTAVIYVDGKKIAEGAFDILPCKNRNLAFGSIGNGFAYPLNGSLGETWVYDRAFSAPEVAEKYLKERESQE